MKTLEEERKDNNILIAEFLGANLYEPFDYEMYGVVPTIKGGEIAIRLEKVVELEKEEYDRLNELF